MIDMNILLATLMIFVSLSLGQTHIVQRRNANSADLKRICYYVSWSQYRQRDGHYVVSDVDPHLCTHLIFSFSQLNSNTFLVENFEWNDPQQLANLVALKNQNPSLKIMIAIGGWNAGVHRFQAMTSTQANRSKFIQSLLGFLKQYNLDGFDLDWEYPSYSDRDRLTDLMKELRAAFQNNYLLSIAMGVGQAKLNNYDLKALSNYVDWFGLMTYDLAGAWDKKAGYHSPLYATRTGDTLNQDWVVTEFIRRGVPSYQIILGIPTYGRSFTVSTNGPNAIGSAASAGAAGPLTGAAGFLAYYEICNNVLSGGWVEGHDTNAESAFAYGGNQWVGYDNIASTKVKSEYVLQKGLGGAMVWDISMDDFRNICGDGKYPIIGTIKTVLSGGQVTIPAPAPAPVTSPFPVTTTVPATDSSATTTTTVPTPAPSSGEFSCPVSNGWFSHPSDCNKFYRCVEGYPHLQQCQTGLAFNEKHAYCDWPANVNGC